MSDPHVLLPPEFEQIRIVVRAPLAQLELLTADFFEEGVGGILEEEGAICAYPETEAELARLLDLIAARNVKWGDVLSAELEPVDVRWNTEWQKHLVPERVSDSFTMRPTHSGPPEGTEEQTIWFTPHASFGAGEHLTTKLAATFVEEHVRARPGIHCLDVGTGSGVLALVAVKSGAEHVLAVDIDKVAVESAKENALYNDCEHQITIDRGSVELTDESFDFVIANMNTHLLLPIAVDLSARVAPRGTLVVTGLLREDIPEVRASFERTGLKWTSQRDLDEWALLAFVGGPSVRQLKSGSRQRAPRGRPRRRRS